MAGNTNKTLAIVMVAMIMVCSLMENPTNATSLDYGAIGKGDARCKDGKCEILGDPANNYTRGCEPEEHCRSGSSGSPDQ